MPQVHSIDSASHCKWSWHSRILKYRYDIRAVIVVNIIMFVAFWIFSSCSAAVIAPLSKQFHLTDSQIGFINTADDIGRIPFVLIASYIGTRMHVPVLLGSSAFIYALCSLAIVIPYFIFKHGKGMDELASTFSETLNATATSTPYVCSVNSTFPVYNSTAALDMEYGDSIAYYVYVGSYVLIGVAAAPWASLYYWYIDENCSGDRFPLLIAIMDSVSMVGPIIGSYLAAAINKLPVDLKSTDISPEDPTFIGAWWLGMLIAASLCLATCPLLCLFPRTMKSDVEIKQFLREASKKEMTRKISISLSDKRRRSQTMSTVSGLLDDKDGEDRQKLVTETTPAERLNMYIKVMNNIYRPRNVPAFIKRLATNYIYLLLVLVFVAWRYEYGKSVFEYKYFTRQFGLADWKATAIIGVQSTISSVCTGVGIFIGGLFVHKVRPTFSQAAGYIASLYLVMSLFSIGQLFIGCENFPIDGLDYDNPTNTSLQTSCNTNCSCHTYAYKPVCDNGLTYFSPCHAGCTSLNSTKDKLFSDCSCTNSGFATNGACTPSCSSYYIYNFIEIMKSTLDSFALNALLLVTLRCLDSTEKAFALGFRSFLSSVAGIPVAYVYGAVLDSACLVWQETFSSTNKRGVCWVYDLPLYRQRFWAIPIAFRLFEVLIEVLIMFLTIGKQITMYDDEYHKERKKSKNDNSDVITELSEINAKDDNQRQRRVDVDASLETTNLTV